jgi:5-methyltetrahydropteroyltriglutamate--homocysteine methyltransferase
MAPRSDLPLLPTTVVGSYPQPDWLIDHERLKSHNVPRVPAGDVWRFEGAELAQALDDAARLAIDDMERAGIDIVTDGEVRRESYSNRFTAALEGLDASRPATVSPHPGRFVEVPRVTGQVRRIRAVEVEDLSFLRRHASRRTKVTLPGPFTMAKQCADEFYGDPEALTLAFAEAVNAEARELAAAGADVIQLDEPWLRADPEGARRCAVRGIDRAFEGVGAGKAVHLCFGYGFIVPWDKPRAYPFLEELASSSVEQISIEAAQPDLDLEVLGALDGKTVVLGVLDLSTPKVETPEAVARRIRAALAHLPPERLMPAPDCGMKYLPRASAYGKLKALAEGAAIVRRELEGRRDTARR